MAKVARWRVLAYGMYKVNQMDDILRGESLMRLLRLMCKRPRSRRIILICATWVSGLFDHLSTERAFDVSRNIVDLLTLTLQRLSQDKSTVADFYRFLPTLYVELVYWKTSAHLF